MFWYLQKTSTKVIVLIPINKLVLDCYGYEYFDGFYGCDYPQDPIQLKSEMIHVITFYNCKLLWVSKLQLGVALSTSHTNYKALYQYLRDLFILKKTYQISRCIIKLGCFYTKYYAKFNSLWVKSGSYTGCYQP